MTYKFSQKSLNKLKGVHPDLVLVVNKAIMLSPVDFSVNEGVRSIERQKHLVATNKSQTMHSKHLIQKDGYGHAVDLIPYPVTWELEQFYPIMEAMRKASKELNINVRWGGSWVNITNTVESPKVLINRYSEERKKAGRKVFIDAPHFELI